MINHFYSELDSDTEPFLKEIFITSAHIPSGLKPVGIASPNFQPAGRPGILSGTSEGIFT